MPIFFSLSKDKTELHTTINENAKKLKEAEDEFLTKTKEIEMIESQIDEKIKKIVSSFNAW